MMVWLSKVTSKKNSKTLKCACIRVRGCIMFHSNISVKQNVVKVTCNNIKEPYISAIWTAGV